MERYQSVIDGERIGGDSELPNVNPSDIRTILGITEQVDVAKVDHAVGVARAAQKKWARTGMLERHDVLMRASHLIHERRDRIARAISSEEGKVLKEGYAEAERSRRIFEYFAAEAMRNVGDKVDSLKAGADAEIVREPIGTVGLITPWNFPFAIPSWKIAPALAFGNAVVMKASSETPWSGVLMAQILEDAGLPRGVFNLLLGSGSKLGSAMASHRGLDAISFTGSTATGMSMAGTVAGRLGKILMEMGGKNPLVVMDDADVPTAVNCAMMGLYYGTGQKCTSSSRFLVQAGIHDAFVDALARKLESTRVGHALDAASEIGPVCSGAQFEKDLSYIEIAREEGAEIVTGGEHLSRETEGYYVSPALVVGATHGMRISREEIFGPVGAVIKVDDFEEAVSVSNDTEYGLSAGICTSSLKYASEFKRRAEAGVVTVNLPTSGGDFHIAFGGHKASGYGGKEQGQYAKDFFTRIKSCYTLPA